jgi:hypothetical protein
MSAVIRQVGSFVLSAAIAQYVSSHSAGRFLRIVSCDSSVSMSAVIRQVDAYVLSAAVAQSVVTVWSVGLEFDFCQRRYFVSLSHQT